MKNLMNLKNLTVLIILVIFISACSSDDDNAQEYPTDILGTWSLNYYLENNQLENEIDCEEDIEYEFISDGTYAKTTFITSENGSCTPALIVNGSWETIDPENIRLTPSSSTQSSETINYNLINNGSELEIFRSANLTELYTK